MSVCRIAVFLCLFGVLNNPDLVYVLALSVVCEAVVVTGALITETSKLAGTVALCVPVMEVCSHFVLFSGGHRGGGVRVGSEWLAVLWKVGGFYLACVSGCSSLLFVVVVKGEWPAMPGKCSRPRRRNRILVPVRRDGTRLAVIKAPSGEGSCRCSACFLASGSSRSCCEEEDEVTAGDAAGVKTTPCLCFGVIFVLQGFLCKELSDCPMVVVALQFVSGGFL